MNITLTILNINNDAMHHDPETQGHTTVQLLLSVGLIFATFNAFCQAVEGVSVNIFGDGNPLNGVEDSREQVVNGRFGAGRLADQPVNAGTVKCDGKIRGTAVVVDTREFVSGFRGVVLASAAHVLYDLDKKQRFKHCEFHFLALDQFAGYRAEIDLNHVRMGSFDPERATGEPEFGEGDWAFLYIPKPWKSFHPGHTISVREFSFSLMEAYQQSGGGLSLVAYDSSAGVMSISRNCKVIESGSDDLGGGSWNGQLLDDCDSGGGASGGGIIATVNQQQFLIGIRSGAHWSEQDFPASDYPSGPPDGSVWSRHSNTNFGRAIDAHLLVELDDFIHTLKNIDNIL